MDELKKKIEKKQVDQGTKMEREILKKDNIEKLETESKI